MVVRQVPSNTCAKCGAALADATVCPACATDASIDPLIGRTIGKRYEILELLGVGGMGRVYRAMHVGLGRMVAVKFINPKHLANQAAVARFMLEARAASRLSHPNVISIHDFGGGTAGEGEDLYLVMELLSGPSLGEVLRAGAMSVPRAIDVLCQILAALNEAHAHGVTHRDIKPENIILQPVGSGADHVKVIDFGIAKVQAGTNVTRPGEIVGTPRYMAPEQARGQPAGPATDIYAVGVLLFQMLTGRRPFNGRVAYEVILQILSAPRPDPSEVAPEREIPPQLGAVCMRAMNIDPADRYATAEEFARALLAAVGEPWSAGHTMLFTPRGPITEPSGEPLKSRPPPSMGTGHTSSVRPPPSVPNATKVEPRHRAFMTPTPMPASKRGPLTPVPHNYVPASPVSITPTAARHTPMSLTPMALTPVSITPVSITPAAFTPEPDGERYRPTTRMQRIGSEPPLLGRTADLAWVRDHLSFVPGAARLALCGRAGVGRSRLLDEVGNLARQMGATVLRMPPGPPVPLGEVSGDGLRAMILALLGEDAVMGLVQSGGQEPVLVTLRRFFADEPRLQAIPMGTPAALLRWAIQRTVAADPSSRVLLAIDDVDLLDGVTQTALAGALSGLPIPGLVAILTSGHASGRWAPDAIMVRHISGLSQEDALRWSSAARCPALGRSDDDIEPLYVELLLRGWGDLPGNAAHPASLRDLVEMRVQNLTPLELQLLCAAAVVGARHLDALGKLVEHHGNLHDPLFVLEQSGLISREGSVVRVRHALYAREALALAPRSALNELHARAAEMLSSGQHPTELRTYHALRGRRGLDAFLNVDDSVRLRLAMGDRDGAIRLLGDAFQAARSEVLADELEAGLVWAPIARRFGSVLLESGRVDEAYGVLHEILAHISRRTIEYVLVAEQLASVAQHRGRHDEAQTLLQDAVDVAELVGDTPAATRILESIGPHSSGKRPSTPEVARVPQASSPETRITPWKAPRTTRNL